ncbi:MAG: hypothetical protein KAT83_01145 [Candidatus Aenigmarchaeota archaeon]|nr:hypothetical protein [Candidatus Aenigmarchaeota archaeon]
MRSKYILAVVLVLAALVSGCIFDKQDAPQVEPLDESAVSSVDAELDTIVSDLEESSLIAAELEDDINIDELEIALE